MEAGLILNSDMQRRRLRGAEFVEKQRLHVLVDARGEPQFQSVGAIDFQRFLQVAPLVTSRIWGVHADTALTPDLTDHGQ